MNLTAAKMPRGHNSHPALRQQKGTAGSATEPLLLSGGSSDGGGAADGGGQSAAAAAARLWAAIREGEEARQTGGADGYESLDYDTVRQCLCPASLLLSCPR